jgi:hypothetical protein
MANTTAQGLPASPSGSFQTKVTGVQSDAAELDTENPAVPAA